jgi:hypothetical protein
MSRPARQARSRSGCRLRISAWTPTLISCGRVDQSSAEPVAGAERPLEVARPSNRETPIEQTPEVT